MLVFQKVAEFPLLDLVKNLVCRECMQNQWAFVS